MLRSLHISVVGEKLYPFIDNVDYDGFLEAGGTTKQWEDCINILYGGFPGYNGEGSYTKYLKEQADFLGKKYDAWDRSKGEVKP